MPTSILSQMVAQFVQKHGRLPERIELSPLAMAILAARRSAAPLWGRIPVVCQEIEVSRLTQDPASRILGVDVQVQEEEARLVAFNLRA